ncbi:hypothetical protein FYL58_26460 [Klebsiella aerogenes]|nr:hypothetical protein BB747_29405 [Klebsiella pneumoniae]ECJ4008611.1 hypothetical protein [Salmonella enterica subsp. enterica]EIW9480558.1 hypothetical protein [Klebsiella aerogenes]MBL3695970.1 hypothetical protein [Pluralibacter gergoviae]MRS50476.1 hypothetical protein [Salmonella enterica subsp. enterica serovar Muenchen]QDM78339.1 hypothetical protein FNJ81_24675 [Escherichia coli]
MFNTSQNDKMVGVLSGPERRRRRTPQEKRHCCKVSDEAAFCLIQRPYISKTLLTRRISPRGSP